MQLPGTNGSFEVLQNHAALISTLERGPVKVTAGGNVQTFTIDGGVVEVLKNQVIVMAEAVLAWVTPANPLKKPRAFLVRGFLLGLGKGYKV